MEIVLDKLECFGRRQGLFAYCPIRTLPKGCCPESSTEVIDFDSTKDIICKKNNWNPLKSCDALKILVKQGRIDFVEMKSMKGFIDNQLKDCANPEEKIDEQLDKFSISDKLYDSLSLLDSIARDRTLDFSVEEQAAYYAVPKQLVVVTDIVLERNPLEALIFNLDVLSQISSAMEHKVADALREKMAGLELKDLRHQICAPELLKNSSFDSRYI